VAVGEQPDQDAVEQAALSDDHALDLVHDVAEERALLLDLLGGGGVGHGGRAPAKRVAEDTGRRIGMIRAGRRVPPGSTDAGGASILRLPTSVTVRAQLHRSIAMKPSPWIARRIDVAAAAPLLALLLSAPAGAQRAPGGKGIMNGPPPPGLNRETMWPAPTEADWKRPCLVHFQRTWDDALAVAKEENKPILICVNMDGEIASEHYAGIRYRQPDIATLYDPYVCVVVSVYRHTPRDHDEAGRRILCPRFGSVTCGEHIQIEPYLYEKYFDGKRIAPRHIEVDLDGSAVYDVFYSWDTATVFDALKDGIAMRTSPPRTIVRGDRPLLERVASRDNGDRSAVEAAYRAGDAAQRRALLDAAVAHADAAPLDLLREALFGLDDELARRAREGLAKAATPEAVGLVNEALRAPMAPAERDALVAALGRLGDSSPRARTLARVHQGVAAKSAAVDATAWSYALEVPAKPRDPAAFAKLRARQDEIVKGGDPASRVALSEALFESATEPDADPRFARLLALDARNVAQSALDAGAGGYAAHAALAVAQRWLGELDEARISAVAAIGALAGKVPERPREDAAANVLELFALARQREIGAALRAKSEWAATALADVHAAYTVLALHPAGTDAQAADHYDLLQWFGAKGEAGRALERGVARFPDSSLLHGRMRVRVLEERGVDGLDAAYAELLAKHPSPELERFAAYADLVAAEFRRRNGDGGAALADYDRALARCDRVAAAKAELKDGADHDAAIALAGKARLLFERRDDDGALAQLLASFERRPASAAILDGLNLSAVDTARMVLARLKEEKRDDAAARLEAALQKLDPSQLELPAYERDNGPGGFGPGQRRPRGGER